MMMKKVVAGVLTVGMCMSMMACGNSNDEPVVSEAAQNADLTALMVTVDNDAYTLADYVNSYAYNRAYMNSSLSYYGVSLDDVLVDEEAGAMYATELQTMAQEQLVYLSVISSRFEMEGLSLEQANVDAQMEELYESYGGRNEYESTLKEMNISTDAFAQYIQASMMADMLNELYLGENGTMTPAEDEKRAYFEENYLRAKHVLLKTTDDDGNQLENVEEITTLAQQIATRAQAGEDFDSLIATYGEDSGVEGSPDGYVFTNDEMVTAFEDGTKALAMNEISAPVESSFGWHIIQRLPLREEDYESVKQNVSDAILSFSSLYTQWSEQAVLDINEQLTAFTDADYIAMAKRVNA